MKATELRIGNLVRVNDIPVEVLWFDYEGAVCQTLDKKCQCDMNIEPIELTEEWLVKFGFGFKEYDSLGWIESPSDMFYSLEKRGEYYYPYETDNVIQFELKYVHQLQNLYFALTGEELIIK